MPPSHAVHYKPRHGRHDGSLGGHHDEPHDGPHALSSEELGLLEPSEDAEETARAWEEYDHQHMLPLEQEKTKHYSDYEWGPLPGPPLKGAQTPASRVQSSLWPELVESDALSEYEVWAPARHADPGGTHTFGIVRTRPADASAGGAELLMEAEVAPAPGRGGNLAGGPPLVTLRRIRGMADEWRPALMVVKGGSPYGEKQTMSMLDDSGELWANFTPGLASDCYFAMSGRSEQQLRFSADMFGDGRSADSYRKGEVRAFDGNERLVVESKHRISGEHQGSEQSILTVRVGADVDPLTVLGSLFSIGFLQACATGSQPWWLLGAPRPAATQRHNTATGGKVTLITPVSMAYVNSAPPRQVVTIEGGQPDDVLQTAARIRNAKEGEDEGGLAGLASCDDETCVRMGCGGALILCFFALLVFLFVVCYGSTWRADCADGAAMVLEDMPSKCADIFRYNFVSEDLFSTCHPFCQRELGSAYAEPVCHGFMGLSKYPLDVVCGKVYVYEVMQRYPVWTRHVLFPTAVCVLVLLTLIARGLIGGSDPGGALSPRALHVEAGEQGYAPLAVPVTAASALEVLPDGNACRASGPFASGRHAAPFGFVPCGSDHEGAHFQVRRQLLGVVLNLVLAPVSVLTWLEQGQIGYAFVMLLGLLSMGDPTAGLRTAAKCLTRGFATEEFLRHSASEGPLVSAMLGGAAFLDFTTAMPGTMGTRRLSLLLLTLANTLVQTGPDAASALAALRLSASGGLDLRDFYAGEAAKRRLGFHSRLGASAQVLGPFVALAWAHLAGHSPTDASGCLALTSGLLFLVTGHFLRCPVLNWPRMYGIRQWTTILALRLLASLGPLSVTVSVAMDGQAIGSLEEMMGFTLVGKLQISLLFLGLAATVVGPILDVRLLETEDALVQELKSTQGKFLDTPPADEGVNGLAIVFVAGACIASSIPLVLAYFQPALLAVLAVLAAAISALAFGDALRVCQGEAAARISRWGD